MAEVATEKKRKSVAFSDGATIVDQNGDVTETTEHGDKTAAETHSAENGGVDEVTVYPTSSRFPVARLSLERYY
jgi:translation initiation factor 2 subunit 2